MNVGQTIVINGELRGGEDLVLHGRAVGAIDLRGHTLTVGTGARVEADVVAKTVIVLGTIVGKVTALERCELQASAVVEGEVTTRKLIMLDGAILNGDVHMSSAEISAAAPAPTG